MKTPYDIIIAPIVTETSMANIADRKYTFKVLKGANKVEIKKAVEEQFKVSVAGGIKPATVRQVVESGAAIVVVGAAIYSAESPAEAAREIRDLIAVAEV